MRVKTIPSDWMDRNGLRLDSGPYLAGAFEARVLLEKLNAEKRPLNELTKGHMGGIFTGPHFARSYVNDPAYGVPFLSSGDMLEADLSWVALLRKTDAESRRLAFLRLQEGMTLISCSGTIGRMVYCRPDMEGMWASQHSMKVVPDPDKIKSGYLYAFLSSRFGVPQVIAGTYGAVIQHIEPEHIADLQVPRLGDVEDDAHKLITKAATLRSQYQSQIREATRLFFESVGLRDITAHEWHSQGSSLGFAANIGSSVSLRALNFNPRYQELVQGLSLVEHVTLGEICAGGRLSRGDRFKRVDSNPEYGIKLIGQKEIFWLEPEGRWIAPQFASADMSVPDETVLIAVQGTLGETEVYCRAAFVTDPSTKHAYSEHLMRVIPDKESGFSGAVLFAFMRSETAFRCLRSMSAGSKQQEPHHKLLSELPVPLLDETSRQGVETLVRSAYKARNEALLLEQSAIEIVEETIQESA